MKNPIVSIDYIEYAEYEGLISVWRKDQNGNYYRHNYPATVKNHSRCAQLVEKLGWNIRLNKYHIKGWNSYK